jgi:hypothetical protein
LVARPAQSRVKQDGQVAHRVGVAFGRRSLKPLPREREFCIGLLMLSRRDGIVRAGIDAARDIFALGKIKLREHIHAVLIALIR